MGWVELFFQLGHGISFNGRALSEVVKQMACPFIGPIGHVGLSSCKSIHF